MQVAEKFINPDIDTQVRTYCLLGELNCLK